MYEVSPFSLPMISFPWYSWQVGTHPSHPSGLSICGKKIGDLDVDGHAGLLLQLAALLRFHALFNEV